MTNGMTLDDIKKIYENKVKCIDHISRIITYCDSIIAIGGLYLRFKTAKIGNVDVLKSMESSIDAIITDILTDIEKSATICNMPQQEIDKIVTDISEGLALGEVVEYDNATYVALNLKLYFNSVMFNFINQIKGDGLHYLELYLKSRK